MNRRRYIGTAVCVVFGTMGQNATARAQESNPDCVDVIMARAATLRQHNRKTRALAEMQRAAELCPRRADVLLFRDMLQQEVHGSEGTLTFDYKGWSDGRPSYYEPQLALRKNTERGPVILRAARLARHGSDDTKLELEAYPAFPGGYGALGLGYAAHGTLYSRTAMSVQLFKALPPTLEASLGYRRLGFPSAVNVYMASLGNYYREYLITARVNRVSGGASGASAALSGRRYLADDGRFVGVHLITGSIRDDMRTESDFAVRSSRSIGTEALFLIKRRWILSGRGAVGRDQLGAGRSVVFSSATIGFGARF